MHIMLRVIPGSISGVLIQKVPLILYHLKKLQNRTGKEIILLKKQHYLYNISNYQV